MGNHLFQNLTFQHSDLAKLIIQIGSLSSSSKSIKFSSCPVHFPESYVFSQVPRRQSGLHLPSPLHSAISIPLSCFPLQQYQGRYIFLDLRAVDIHVFVAPGLALVLDKSFSLLWKEQRWGIKAFLKQWVNAEMDSFVRTRRIQLLQEALEQSEVQTALEIASTDKNDLSTETLVKRNSMHSSERIFLTSTIILLQLRSSIMP